MRLLCLLLACFYTQLTIAGPIPCGPDVTYPIAGAPPIADYDINCNLIMKGNQIWWFPRRTNLSAYDLTEPWPTSLTAVAVDMTHFGTQMIDGKLQPSDRIRSDDIRGLYGLYFDYDGQPAGPLPKLTLPIDIRPRILPVVTVEMFAEIGWQGFSLPNSLSMWSTELRSASVASGSPRSRALNVVEKPVVFNGCGAFFTPSRPYGSKDCTLSSDDATGWLHLAAIFNQSAASVTIWLNGMFSQTFAFAAESALDLGLSTININGRAGTSTYDPSGLSLAYFRVYDRALTQAELRAVNDPWFALYNQPRINNVPIFRHRRFCIHSV